MTEDWHLFRLSRPNVLVIGPDQDIDSVITSITGRPAASVPKWSDHSSGGASPERAPETVIVRNVMALDAAEQQRLNQWLDERMGIRVIATAPEPMYSMVERRLFLESLYYRLNVVCIEASQLSAGQA